MIPFNSFDFQDRWREELVRAMTRVLDSKWYVMGEELRSFEASYAELHGVEYCVGVANGLDAITISLRALDIGPGDEVVVPSNTYIATWLAVSTVGAVPIPVEPDPVTYNITSASIEAAITPRTRAIIPVHLYGQACDMASIMDVARRNSLHVVEDNAQGHLATWRGQITGSFGDVNATSFYPSKNLGALGDGGALTTQSSALDRRARAFRNYGSEVRYLNRVRGANSRLDELQAAILNVKLPHLEQLTSERRQLAEQYDEYLLGCDAVVRPRVLDGATHVYHLYVIQCERRDELLVHLREKGAQALIHYPVPPHLQEAYADADFRRGQFPIAESIAEQCLSLPLYPGMTGHQVARVCDLIKDFYE